MVLQILICQIAVQYNGNYEKNNINIQEAFYKMIISISKFEAYISFLNKPNNWCGSE